MAAAAIPETVTVPGQLVYDAIVRLSAALAGVQAIADGDSPIGDEINQAVYYLFEAAFGPYHIDDDLTLAPLLEQAEEDARQLLNTCLGLKVAAS